MPEPTNNSGVREIHFLDALHLVRLSRIARKYSSPTCDSYKRLSFSTSNSKSRDKEVRIEGRFKKGYKKAVSTRLSDFKPPQNRVVSDYVIFHVINKPPCDDKVFLKLFGRRCYASGGSRSICCAVGFYFYHQTFERWRKNVPDTGCLAERHEFIVVVLSRNAAMRFD